MYRNNKTELNMFTGYVTFISIALHSTVTNSSIATLFTPFDWAITLSYCSVYLPRLHISIG